ncbi:MAG TPA: HDOD domain-containing protein [Acidobacteriota bacterium]|nr:HDOD domain-containing protein [Acidobacteriota bacterium]
MKAADLSGFIEELGQLPTLPAVAVRLLETTSDEESGLSEIARLIETDHSLTAKILKVANSTYFCRSGEVTTIDRATALLGKDLVRGLVLSAVVFETIHPEKVQAFNLRQFWNHCVACAIASETLARRFAYRRPMEAFVAGLLHDMGKLILAHWNAEEYSKVVLQAREGKGRLLENEEAHFGIGHTGVAKLAMERWRFPSDLVEAAWLHHQPISYFGDSPQRNPAFIVKAANSLCRLFRIGDSGDPGENWNLERLSMVTGLSAEELRRTASRVLERFEEVAGYFNWEADNKQLYLQAVQRANEQLGQMQINLDVEKRRLQRKEKALSAIHRLHEALDETTSPARGVVHVINMLDEFLPLRRALAYVALKRSPGLEGCIKGSSGQAGNRFIVPLEPGERQEFDRLTARAQLSLLQRKLREGKSMEAEEGALSGMLFSPDLLVFPLETQRGSIGQVLAEVDSKSPEVAEMVEAARHFVHGAALALHRLLLTEELQVQAEELAQTGRKVEETERRLFHTERLASVGRLAAGAAHEINNPLTVISGHAELMLLGTEDEKQKHRLEEIVRQIERISEITGDLMGLARPAEPQVEPVQVESILDRTLDLLRQRMRLANIKVLRRYGDDVPPVLGDAKQLEQVFLNLCINAVQAMKDGGKLTISLRRGENSKEVEIDFQDTGEGIEPQDLPSIFDPFFTTKREGEGTGLGLAICLTIIRNHGGRVLVSSKPDKGSTFRIVLPRAGEAPVGRSSAKIEAGEGNPGGPSIQAKLLAVDDESAIREVLGQALSGKDWKIDFAEDGARALQKLEKSDYDAVLLDLRMPKKAGMEVLQVLRKSRPQLPVIVISGVAHENEFKAAKTAGAFACLRKPFRMSTLIEVVHEAVKQHETSA